MLIPIMVIGVLSICIPATIYAKTSSFWYEMGVAVYGSTKYNLSKAYTYIYSTANTYRRSDGRLTNPKLNYKLQMGKYSKTAPANGTQMNINCGRINAGTYTINLFVTNTGYRYEKYVKGSGRIVQ